MGTEYGRRDFLKMGGTVGAGLVLGGTALSDLPRGVNKNSKEVNKTPKAKERFGFNDNVVIIDDHTHIWPRAEEVWERDFKSVDEHMKCLQMSLINPRRSARLVKDDSLVKDAWKTLLSENLTGTLRDVNLRFEEGRYVWEANGEKYYVLPYSGSSPPELIISLMDEVGVDKAVLQHKPHTYKLTKYYSRAMHKYPGRLIGLAKIYWPKAYTGEVIEELRMDIEVLGFKGLFYRNPAPGWDGYGNFHTSKYDPLWRAVRSLGIPVYFCFVPEDDFPILKVKKWVERFPDIPRVIVHGFPPEFLIDENTMKIRDICVDIVKNHNIYLELLPRCHKRNFPEGPKTDQMIRCLYETFGPSKLLWGSELGWTNTASKYGNLLGYFEEKCDYMSKDDLKLILGGNLQKLYGI